MAIMFITPTFNPLTNPVDRWRPLTPNTFFFLQETITDLQVSGRTRDPQGRVETQTLVPITISQEPEVVTKPPKIWNTKTL